MKWNTNFFTITVLVSLFSSCVTYEGHKPGREYFLKFVNEEGTPLKGVFVYCLAIVGTGATSEIIADQLNSSATASQGDGIVRMKHRSIPTSTTVIPLMYAWSTKLDVECTYKLSGVEVFKGNLGEISKQEIVRVITK